MGPGLASQDGTSSFVLPPECLLCALRPSKQFRDGGHLVNVS